MNARVQELERIAEQYHLNTEVPDKFIENICQEHCCDWLAGLIHPHERVIELGYGEGHTLARLSTLSSNYTMVEGAASLAALVREKHPSVEVVQALFEEHAPQESCDKLLALHVLEHVDHPVSLAKHLRSWLRPDGEMVVVVPNRDSLHRQLAVAMGLQPALDTLSARDHLVGHQRVYDFTLLEEHLRQAGFECFERRGFFLKTLPNGMMLDHPTALIQALNTVGDALPAHLMANIAVRARLTD